MGIRSSIANFISGGQLIETQQQLDRSEQVNRDLRSNKGAKRAGYFKSALSDHTTGSWSKTPVPINQLLQTELSKMIARSRALAENDPYIKRFYRVSKANVIGSAGFKFSAALKTLKGQPDKRANEAVESAWARACKKGVIDFEGERTFRDLCELMLVSLYRDGAILGQHIRNPRANDFGYQFKLLDPMLLQLTSDRSPFNRGHKITLGVEYDGNNRRVAYWFHSLDSRHDDYYMIGGRGYVRIPASEIIHVFQGEYVGQARGIPITQAAQFRAGMLDEYEGAELSAAVGGSKVAGIIERNEEGEGWDGEDDEAYGDESDDDDFYMELENNSVHMLPHGSKWVSHNPQHPNSSYDSFIKGVLRGVAAALGISYHVLANDLQGVNYSSGRLGALEDREAWKLVQQWMIEHVIEPIYREWLAQALLKGAITFPSGTPLVASSFNRIADATKFHGRRWAWVDPQKDITAHEKAVALRIASRSSIIRERGEDPEQVWDEIKRENELLKSLGLDIAAKPEPSKPKADPKADEESNDEDQEDETDESEKAD